LAAQLRAGVQGLRWHLIESTTAIQPLIIGSNQEALDVMACLHQQGLWAPAIRPPTVPEGTARLRLSLSAAHAATDVDRLIAVLHWAQTEVTLPPKNASGNV
jgi:8-amino-7-oxononanoate synthase